MVRPPAVATALYPNETPDKKAEIHPASVTGPALMIRLWYLSALNGAFVS